MYIVRGVGGGGGGGRTFGKIYMNKIINGLLCSSVGIYQRFLEKMKNFYFILNFDSVLIIAFHLTTH